MSVNSRIVRNKNSDEVNSSKVRDGGAVSSGKTASLECLIPLLIEREIEVAVVTNDLLTTEDADRLKSKALLPPSRITTVETGSCPHTAIRKNPTMNLLAIQDLHLLHLINIKSKKIIAIALVVLRNNTLKLQLKCNPEGQTMIAHQYETHPLQVSCPFRLDRGGDLAEGKAPNNHRAYLYLRNNSPGLFAEDELNLSLCLEEKTKLYLTEQSATKVHPTMMPEVTAKVHDRWTFAKDAR